MHKKASTSGGRSPTTGTRSLTGALPLGPTGWLPRPRYFMPGRYSEGGYNGWSLHKNCWVYLYAKWQIIDINTYYFSVEIVLIAQTVIFMITIRPSSADVMNIVVAIIWPKRAPECIKMHHFEGEHAKIFLGRGLRPHPRRRLRRLHASAFGTRPPRPHFTPP